MIKLKLMLKIPENIMKLTNISNIKAQIQAAGFNFKKKFGQNFLTNENVIERIADNAPEAVLEIGPGLGTLTCALCERAKKVVAVEIDPELIPLLKENLSEFDNIEILNCDIMKLDIAALVREKFSHYEHIGVCANLPYYITTPVIMALAESGAGFESVTVMIQKEVVHRLCASAGDSDYGAISAALSYYGRCEKLFDVSAGNFIPRPKVDSAVMKIKFHEKPPVDADKKMLMRVIRGAFAQRRKTLSNSLSSEFHELSKSELADIISESGHDSGIRGEKLSLEDFSELAKIISQKINNL